MAKLSKFYQITNQILIEYIADQYAANNAPETTKSVNYTVYTGLDDNVYYTETPNETEDNKLDYSDPQYFIKFSDESNSEYKFMGFYKNEYGQYTNREFIDNIISNEKYVKSYKKSDDTVPMLYDTIRIHFIYGFTLNNLAGFTLQVKTLAKYLGPTQNIIGYNHLQTDDFGNPVFKTITDLNGNKLEPLNWKQKDIYLLDYFFPKECLNFDGIVKYHKVPIYQHDAYYDRYIEIKVPSAYYLSLDSLSSGNSVILTCPNLYGNIKIGQYIAPQNNHVCYQIDSSIYYLPEFTDPNYIEYYKRGEYMKLPQYGLAPTYDNMTYNREIVYNILPDPEIIINFATVRDTNLTPIVIDNNVKNDIDLLYSSPRFGTFKYASMFFQDSINQIALQYKSNSDYFNIRIFEDQNNNEIVYYPIFGETLDAPALNYEIMQNIENGQIPMITEAFEDSMNNIEQFVELYGENANKWIIYNELTVQYNYIKGTNSTSSTTIISSKSTQHFTSIIDYNYSSKEEAIAAGEFWKSYFVPRPPIKTNQTCKTILLSYTCRLVNRLSNVEAIRNATLNIDATKYNTKTATIKDVITYNIFNKYTKDVVKPTTVVKETTDKYIRSYYDATNIVVKDMETNSLYTQGQMTLYLKHSSTNYMFRLFTINQDNVRVPYDLTGPFRYKLVFPTIHGGKIEIMPNKDSKDVNLHIGEIVFYITEEQVKRIMGVPANERYFAITTDTDKNNQQISTLYEGKVTYR